MFAVVGTQNKALSAFNGDTQHWYQTTTNSYGAGGTKLATGSSTTVQWTVVSGYWCIAAVAVKRQYDTAATFALAEDNKMGITKLAPTRLRLLASNGASSSTGPIQYQLQVAETATCASGTYVAVGSDTDWQMVDSTYYGDGAATSNVTSGLTDPGRLHLCGRPAQGHERTPPLAITLNASGFTEIEFAVRRPQRHQPAGITVSDCYNTTTGAVFNNVHQLCPGAGEWDDGDQSVVVCGHGYGHAVRVGWQTAQEVENKGFNLYRATSPAGRM